MSLRGENLDRGKYPFQPIHIRKFGSSQSLWDKALVNEDTLLRTHSCPWCFLGCANWETFVADTKCFWTKSETFFVSATNVAHAGKRGDICVGNNVSATMCPQQCVLVCLDLKSYSETCIKQTPSISFYFIYSIFTALVETLTPDWVRKFCSHNYCKINLHLADTSVKQTQTPILSHFVVQNLQFTCQRETP